jgi:hypothetical protein
VQKAVDELGNEALPYYMSLAPVRMLNDNDREMNVYEIGNCINKMNEIRKKNNEIAEFTKKETTNVLGKVLYTASMAMKNAYSRSDA